ncbi:MAG: hypothetical protein LBQ75_06135 [Zoogloeaceae bacterium]|jgi:hypothetical protein|nr:hypothetical protein [Zoogloeaceae bacterium]
MTEWGDAKALNSRLRENDEGETAKIGARQNALPAAQKERLKREAGKTA